MRRTETNTRASRRGPQPAPVPRVARRMTLTALVCLATGGTGGLLLFGCAPGVRSAPAGKGASAGWQSYKDARLGFALDKPAGWAVRADDHSILIQSPDHSQTVLMEAFQASPGESAEAHLQRLPADRAALFPQARLDGVAAQPSKGDEVAAALSYQSAQGSGQGRVLCLRHPRKGPAVRSRCPRLRASRPPTRS